MHYPNPRDALLDPLPGNEMDSHQYQDSVMKPSWKDSIYLQREQLAGLLREPLTRLAEKCAPVWGNREKLDAVLKEGFASIPHGMSLYCLGTDAVQISDSVGQSGLAVEHFGRDRSQRPYMKEAVPNWGFLLSDAISVCLNIGHLSPRCKWCARIPIRWATLARISTCATCR